VGHEVADNGDGMKNGENGGKKEVRFIAASRVFNSTRAESTGCKGNDGGLWGQVQSEEGSLNRRLGRSGANVHGGGHTEIKNNEGGGKRQLFPKKSQKKKRYLKRISKMCGKLRNEGGGVGGVDPKK